MRCLRQQTVLNNLKANYQVERTEFTVNATTVTPANLSRVSTATEWPAWRHRRRWLTILYCHRPDKYIDIILLQSTAAYAELRQTPHDNELLIQQILKNVSYRVLQPITEHPTEQCERQVW